PSTAASFSAASTPSSSGASKPSASRDSPTAPPEPQLVSLPPTRDTNRVKDIFPSPTSPKPTNATRVPFYVDSNGHMRVYTSSRESQLVSLFKDSQEVMKATYTLIDTWSRQIAAGADDRVLANYRSLYAVLQDHHAALHAQQLECHKALAAQKDYAFNRYHEAYLQQQASFSHYEEMVRTYMAERDREPLYPAPPTTAGQQPQ
ncbi:hypothetical protein BGZ73_007350, partial [Actinomortierella ambigua]